MMDGWTAALEATPLAQALRNSVWAYPLVNAGHLLGAALLVGAVVPLDLRLLGLWPTIPLAPLWRILTRFAAIGLGLAAVCGALLFICRATAYAGSGLFLSKMVVVAVGAVNALALQTGFAGGRGPAGWETARPPIWTRAAAGLSLTAWLTALVLGRLVGYF